MGRLLSLFLFLISFVGPAQAQCLPTAASNVIAGCAPLEVQFNCPTCSNGTAMWSIGSTTVSGIVATMTLSYPATYIVTLTIVSGTCVGTATTAVNVVTGPAFGCSTTVLGLTNYNEETTVLIYPNPVSEQLRVSFPGLIPTGPIDYRITDNLGQTIKTGYLQGGKFSIPTSELTDGFYQIHLKGPHGAVTKIFMKAR